jgi:AraC-like DNA-binding protein
MAETVNAVLTELTQRDRWRPVALRSRLIQLSILFFRQSAHGGDLRGLTPQQQNAISRLLESTPPDQWLKPRDLAKAAGLSLDYFSRLFRHSHSLSPRQWLLQQRLSYAVVLLQETPLRVGEIAERLGYANLHLFTRQFSACFARSPSHYRQ